MWDATAYSDLQATQLTIEAFRLSIEDQQFGPRFWLRVAAEAHRYLRRGQAKLAFGIGGCSGLILEGRRKAAWKVKRRCWVGGADVGRNGGEEGLVSAIEDGGGDGNGGRRMSTRAVRGIRDSSFFWRGLVL